MSPAVVVVVVGGGGGVVGGGGGGGSGVNKRLGTLTCRFDLGAASNRTGVSCAAASTTLDSAVVVALALAVVLAAAMSPLSFTAVPEPTPCNVTASDLANLEVEGQGFGGRWAAGWESIKF